jgi:hypothetical protein
MAEEMPSDPGGGGINPAAIPIPDLARMLGLTEEKLREHIERGAPTNPDGTMSLMNYGAWLNASRRGGATD